MVTRKLDIDLDVPDFGSKSRSNALQMLMLRQAMQGHKAKETKDILPDTSVPVEANIEGVKWQTPESVSLRKYTKEDVSALSASDAFTRSRNYLLSVMDKDPVKFRESFAKANVNIPGLTQPQTRGNIKGYPTVAGDETAINIQRELDNMSDLLLRLRSGAQINEAEFQRLRGLLPTYKDVTVEVGENGETFPTIRRSLTQFENDLAIAKQRVIQGGYYDAQSWGDQSNSSPIPGMSKQLDDDPLGMFK